jgi:phosphoenolpyruvate-protein kinase (PTS system EI component)
MAPTLVPHAKAVIRGSDAAECEQIARDVLDLSTYYEVDAYLDKLAK